MKELETITEYQLLYLARQELSRRIDECKTQIVKGDTKQSVRRIEKLLGMYCEQQNEIIQRMAEINNGNAE